VSLALERARPSLACAPNAESSAPRTASPCAAIRKPPFPYPPLRNDGNGTNPQMQIVDYDVSAEDRATQRCDLERCLGKPHPEQLALEHGQATSRQESRDV